MVGPQTRRLRTVATHRDQGNDKVLDGREDAKVKETHSGLCNFEIEIGIFGVA